MGPHNASRAGAGDRPTEGSGAPNGLKQEFEELNFDIVDNKNEPLIDRYATCGWHPSST